MFEFFQLFYCLLKVLTEFLKETKLEYFFDQIFVVLRDNLSLRNFDQDIIDHKTKVLYDLN